METLAIGSMEASLFDAGTLPASSGKSSGPSFATQLGDALREVDALQHRADAQATQVALGAGNLHETSIALEQADIAMRVATKVRNKLVDAYQEVMRMSV